MVSVPRAADTRVTVQSKLVARVRPRTALTVSPFSVGVFHVWPEAILPPAWPRGGHRSDSPGGRSASLVPSALTAGRTRPSPFHPLLVLVVRDKMLTLKNCPQSLSPLVFSVFLVSRHRRQTTQ